MKTSLRYSCLDHALREAMQMARERGGLPSPGTPHFATYTTDTTCYELKITARPLGSI